MNKKYKEKITLGMLKLCAFITAAVLILILAYVLYQGLPHINLTFLTTSYKPGLGLEGIWPMIIGTLQLVGLTLLFAAPVGVFAAIYLAEYAKPSRFLNVMRFAIECLSGIPSIVYGLFGYTFFVIFLGLKFSLLSGALTLAIMTLPTIIRTTEEALYAVPRSYREGSLALGATGLTTLFRIVLPSAIPGIVTSIILAIGRVVGETAAVYYTAGTIPGIADSIMKSSRTLAVHLYFLAKEGLDLGQSYASATILIIVVLLLNLTAGKLASILNRRLSGGK